MNTDDEGASWTGHWQTPEAELAMSLNEEFMHVNKRLDEIEKTLSNIFTLLRRNGS